MKNLIDNEAVRFGLECTSYLLSHGGRVLVGGCCPGCDERVIPRSWERLVHCCKKGFNEANIETNSYKLPVLCRAGHSKELEAPVQHRVKRGKTLFKINS
jgi:hypothetical protein